MEQSKKKKSLSSGISILENMQINKHILLKVIRAMKKNQVEQRGQEQGSGNERRPWHCESVDQQSFSEMRRRHLNKKKKQAMQSSA